MAKSLKTNGIKELRALAARTVRQHSLGRIRKTDKEYILSRLQEIEARIIRMEEKGEEDNSWL